MAREFDDVQLDVNFTQASIRENITSEENISLSFGKLSKWYTDFRPEVFDGTSRNDLTYKTKTFTDVIGTSTASADQIFYFGQARQSSWTASMLLRFRVKVYCETDTAYCQYADVTYIISEGQFIYFIINNIVDTTKRPVYYHYLLRLQSVGYNASDLYGNAIGLGLNSSTNATDVNYKRTIIFEILEEKNCTFQFYDSHLKASAIPGAGGSRHAASNVAFTGNQVLPDNNTYSQTYINDRLYAGPNGVKLTSLCAINQNNQMESFTIQSGTGLDKTYYTNGKFVYPPMIYYYSGSADIASGSVIGASTTFPIIASINGSYSANVGSAGSVTGWTPYIPLYYECTFDENGYWSLTENGIVQTFQADKFYIFLGVAVSKYQLSMQPVHPVFYYDGTKLIPADKKFIHDSVVSAATTCTISSGTMVFNLPE